MMISSSLLAHISSWGRREWIQTICSHCWTVSAIQWSSVSSRPFWREEKSLVRSWISWGWGASQRWASRMEVFVESQWETFCGVWCPGLLRSNTAKSWDCHGTFTVRIVNARGMRVHCARRPDTHGHWWGGGVHRWSGSLRLDLPATRCCKLCWRLTVGTRSCRPFVRHLYGRPSTHLWEEMGEVDEIAQGEGGEQGDPWMPILFSLGQHAALGQMPGCKTARGSSHILTTSTWFVRHVESWNIRIHHGKTQLWNRGGSQPAGVAELTLAGRLVEPDAVVWKSDPELSLSQGGLRVLGLHRPLCIVDQLVSKSVEHELLFQRIPTVKDLQAAWLLCCSVEQHAPLSGCAWSSQICHCLSRRGTMTEFGVASRASSTCQHSCRQDHCSDASVQRGLGLGCAVRARHAAHCACWADSLPMVRQRHPDVAGTALCFRAVRDWEGHLRAAGFEPRPWEDIAEGARPRDSAEDEPQLQNKSWQKEAASQVEQYLDSTVCPLSELERALWRSHQGPLASTVFVGISTNRVARFDLQPFRVLTSRRLRLPMPLSSRSC